MRVLSPGRAAATRTIAPAAVAVGHLPRPSHGDGHEGGARIRIVAKVSPAKKGEVMSLAKFDVSDPPKLSSMLTTETVELVIKAIHVPPVKP